MYTANRRPGISRTLLIVWSTVGLLAGLGFWSSAWAQSPPPESPSAPAQVNAPEAATVGSEAPKALPEPTPKELAAARAVLARAVKATFLGKPADLRNFSWSDTGAMYIEEHVFPARTKTVVIPGHCYRSEQLLPMGVVTTSYCDSLGWVWNPKGVRDLLPREWARQRHNNEISLVRVLLEASELSARPLPDTLLPTGPASGVSVASDVVTDWRLWVDQKTGFIVRSDYLDVAPSGPQIVRHVWEYSDYQPASQLLQWPVIRRKTAGGKKLLELALQRAASNIKLEDTFFDRP